MKFDTSPELSDDAVEAMAIAFAKAFMSLPRRAKVCFAEIVEERNGLDSKTKAERLEAFKERRRENQKEHQQATQETSDTEKSQKLAENYTKQTARLTKRTVKQPITSSLKPKYLPL